MIGDDNLWNPALDNDPELRRLNTLLSPFSARARGLALRPVVPASQHNMFRRTLAGLAVVAAACLFLVWLGSHRLDWPTDQAWNFVTESSSGRKESGSLAPGSIIATGAGQTTTLSVARIGTVMLSADSRLQMISTRAGEHRVRLDIGHLRARIWAPPNYFGVESGRAEVIDLGCDFDLWKQADGRGLVYVRNGWITYRVASQEVLVPAGYAVRFDARDFSTPLRPGATPAFANAVQSLELMIAEDGPDADTIRTMSESVARFASDSDAYTLLSLLSRQPRLATSSIYTRLAAALSVPANDTEHRRAWTEGSPDAINAWWKKLPVQPKQWLANWTDLFG
ncbi:MAG: hypothetical protein WBP11_01255 [Dokdonella sp.]